MKNTDFSDSVKHADAGSYDAVSQRFDDFTERFSGRFVERIGELADFPRRQNVLDIGTGTGILALHAAARMAQGTRVTGIDLSEGMLAVARSKAAARGVAERVTFRRMDAERLEVDDASCDAVVSLFALRHFPNPDVALGEMHRVLRPGGRFVVALGAGAPLLSVDGLVAVARRLADEAKRRLGLQLRACEHLDALVRAALPAPDLEAPASAHHHGLDARGVRRLAAAAGIRIESMPWVGNRAFIDSPEEFWEVQSTFSSLARARLQRAPSEVVDELRQKVVDAGRRVRARGGGLVYPSGALILAGVRPGSPRGA